MIKIIRDNIGRKYGIIIKCYFCDFEEVIHQHHIIPKNKGGSNDKDNLIYICPNHHALIHSDKYYLKKTIIGYKLINRLDEIRDKLVFTKEELEKIENRLESHG